MNPDMIKKRKPEDFTKPIAISGMAIGVDQDACGVWYRMGVPYIAAIPFPGQESRWPKSSREAYKAALDAAAGVIHISNRLPSDDAEAGKMLKARNEWMVYTIDELIAVHDGSKGGTGATVREWNYGGNGRIYKIDPREY